MRKECTELTPPFIFSRQKQKERAGKILQGYAASEHTLLSKGCVQLLCTDRLRLMTNGDAVSNTEMGVVSDSYRIP